MKDPRIFFEFLVAQWARAPRSVRLNAGRVAFCVEGSGEWVVNLACEPREAVTKDQGFDADLTLMFSPAAFERFTRGEAPTTGQGFVSFGNHRLLKHLALVLQPPASGVVGLRAQCA